MNDCNNLRDDLIITSLSFVFLFFLFFFFFFFFFFSIFNSFQNKTKQKKFNKKKVKQKRKWITENYTIIIYKALNKMAAWIYFRLDLISLFLPKF